MKQIKLKTILIMLIAFITFPLFSQWIQVNEKQIEPKESGWESRYMERVNNLLYAKTWTSSNTNADTDDGKRYWPAFLARLYLAKDNPANLNNVINVDGRKGIDGEYTGRFYKPFSCPGATMYFLKFYDSINKYDPYQITKMQSLWDSPNREFTSRIDGKMDPIYTCTEFNSENFNWMARTAGYLLSDFYQDNTNINDGNKPAMTYYRDWVNNWVRSTVGCGRVEWGSNVYSGFCFQASAVIYENAKDTNYRNKSRAVMDFMVMEQALRFLENKTIGPESRNKDGGHNGFDGSIWPYLNMWFTDTDNPSGYTNLELQEKIINYAGLWTAGFLPIISYRPPQALVDIAQRKFNTPVEMHNTKPFYKIDFDNFHDWQGNTTNSRKFEFETSYLHHNYTLASLATGRPAKVGPFSELCTWRLGVKGLRQQVFGNTSPNTNISGRSPYEEIGQYRNTMIRLIKGANYAWVNISKDVTANFEESTLFSNLGNGVYLAIKPVRSTGTTSTVFDTIYNQYKWTFNTTELSALIMEVGTIEEHGTFNNFKTLIKTKTVDTSFVNQVSYTSTLGNNLKMEWVNTTTYKYTDNYCSTQTINPAGNYPKVWYDGVLNDFNTWNTYEVVYGDKIVDVKWGGSVMEFKSNFNRAKVEVDPVTANTTFYTNDDLTDTKNEIIKKSDEIIKVFPNPANDVLNIIFKYNKPTNISAEIINVSGQTVKNLNNIKINDTGITTESINTQDLTQGIYILKTIIDNKIHTKKIIVKH